MPHKTYTDVGNVCQASDGGFATALMRTASSQTSGSYNSSLYVSRQEVAVVKTDGAGQVQWTKLAWSGIGADGYKPMIYPLTGGGYLVSLSTRQYRQSTSNGSYQVLVIIQLDGSGEVLRQQVIEEAKLDGSFRAQGILSVADKGFVISGFVYTNARPVPFLMRFDAQGQLQWSRSYAQVTPVPNSYDLAATADGGLILSWFGYGNGDYESFLLKTDATGQQTWLRKYGLLAASSVSETKDQGFVMLGKNSRNTMLVMFRLDKNGNVSWTQVYAPGSGKPYVTPLSIFALDNAYVLTYSGSSGDNELLTTTLLGTEQSRQTVDGIFVSAAGNGILPVADGTFIFLGRNSSGSIILTKTKSDKSVQWSSKIAINN